MHQFLSKDAPSLGVFSFNGEDFHHLATVRHVAVGDMLPVFFNGQLYHTTVCSIDKQKKIVKSQVCSPPSDSAPFADAPLLNTTFVSGCTFLASPTFLQTQIPQWTYFLFQAITKPATFDEIVRTATECGVQQIIPVITQYCQSANITAINSRASRLQKIIREARQQSGSSVPTTVRPPILLAQVQDFLTNEIYPTENFFAKQQIPLVTSTITKAVVFWEASTFLQQPSKKPFQPVKIISFQEFIKNLSCKTDFLAANTPLSKDNSCPQANQNTIKKYCAIFVGSEGGLSSDEILSLCTSTPTEDSPSQKNITPIPQINFVPVHLETNILRAATVVPYVLGALQQTLPQN